MFVEYPAQYTDRFGQDRTTIRNDGAILSMVLRGVQFTGAMLDDWAPVGPIDTDQLQRFSLHHGHLCSYSLELAIPIPVIIDNETIAGKLLAHLELGAPHPNGGLDRERLQLTLVIGTEQHRSCGNHGYFEDALLELQRRLPDAITIKSCFTCAFSDYSPAGAGLFGCLACFRDTKKEYLALHGKDAYFKLQDHIAAFVQETYLCSEYEKRQPGTGYRG